MPSGTTHERINTVLLLSCIIGYLNWSGFGRTTELAIFSISFIFASYFLSPDLDINSKAYKSWGPLRYLWWPYQKIFKHRGWSHHPLLGPATIIANLLIYLTILVILTGFDVKSVPRDYYAHFFVGIVLSIEFHILCDQLPKLSIRSTKNERSH